MSHKQEIRIFALLTILLGVAVAFNGRMQFAPAFGLAGDFWRGAMIGTMLGVQLMLLVRMAKLTRANRRSS